MTTDTTVGHMDKMGKLLRNKGVNVFFSQRNDYSPGAREVCVDRDGIVWDFEYYEPEDKWTGTVQSVTMDIECVSQVATDPEEVIELLLGGIDLQLGYI